MSPVIILVNCQRRYEGTSQHKRWLDALHRAKRHARTLAEIKLAVYTHALARI